MKRVIIFNILMLLIFVGFMPVAYGQETHITGTLKMHPWTQLPVVVSTDIQGGMQSLGNLELSATPATQLNDSVASYKRETGMVVSLVDTTGAANKSRYFEYVGTDTWMEVFVISEWKAGKFYTAGDCVNFESNFYVADAIFTSDASFENDSVRWNACGGKNAAFDISKIVMDGDTLTKIAISGDTIAEADRNNTLATVGYVGESSSSSSSDLDGEKAITRPGWDGVTGFIPNTENVVDFLKRVFYPVSTPLITSFNYSNVTTSGKYSYQSEDDQKMVTDHVGTITVPYSTWNISTDLSFNYEITNRSMSDGSDDTAIKTVEMFSDGTSVGSNTLNSSAATVSGSITPDKSSFSTDIDNNQSSVLNLQVTDEASNVVNLNLNITFTQAQGVAVTSAWMSATDGGSKLLGEGSGASSDPYLIERTGSDITDYFIYGLNFNDDTQADINFIGTYKPSNLTGITATSGSESFTIPNTATSSAFRVGASATGDVANDASSTSSSSYYLLKDKLYCGFLSSDVEPTETAIKALNNSSLKTTSYYNASGISYTNSSSSSGFFVWVIPTYTAATESAPSSFSKKVYYEAAGTWYENSNTNTYYVKVTPPGGGVQSWYWVCIYKASTGSNGSIKVKIAD